VGAGIKSYHILESTHSSADVHYLKADLTRVYIGGLLIDDNIQQITPLNKDTYF
jgi:hypothetical protein